MITLALTQEWVTTLSGIISFVFGGGLVTALVAWYKVKPEAGQIVVSAAQGALVVQTGVIENLKKEIERLNGEVEELKKALSEKDQKIMQLQSMIISMQANQTKHDKQIDDLGKKPFDITQGGSAK